MKLLPGLFVILFASVVGAFADTPATNAPPAASAPTLAKPTSPPAAPVSAPTLKLDDYISELTTTLKLSDDEKKAIQADYLADGERLKNILNNEALSPLQQAQQVSDLRDARNAKIEKLLNDSDRQQAFLKVEAKYRVALTELAADGGLSPAPAPAAAAPSTNAAPAAASTNSPSAAK